MLSFGRYVFLRFYGFNWMFAWMSLPLLVRVPTWNLSTCKYKWKNRHSSVYKAPSEWTTPGMPERENIDFTRIGETTTNREVWWSLVEASSSARWWSREKRRYSLCEIVYVCFADLVESIPTQLLYDFHLRVALPHLYCISSDALVLPTVALHFHSAAMGLLGCGTDNLEGASAEAASPIILLIKGLHSMPLSWPIL